jgi:hypothetical protein
MTSSNNIIKYNKTADDEVIYIGVYGNSLSSYLINVIVKRTNIYNVK